MEFEQLYRRYYRLVLGYFLRRARREEAEELTQETFLNAFRGQCSFRGDSHDSTWLLVIAKHVYANFVRKHRAQMRTGIEVPIDPEGSSEDHPTALLASGEPNALVEALDEEREQILVEAVASLPVRTRQIMRLAFVHGLKYREIAETLGISVNTVKSSIFQGKQKLRRFIQEHAPEQDLILNDDDDQ